MDGRMSRRIVVELKSEVLAAYELTVKEKGYKGTLHDFINEQVLKTFKK